MNRPLKFKVWNKKSNEWCGTIGLNETISHNELEYDTDDLVFVQYTGLKDSKGKEVYEGDVIIDKKYKFFDKKYKEYRQCIWDQERLTYRWVGKNISLPIHTSDDNMTLKEKIVGNIFEHKHLLEK